MDNFKRVAVIGLVVVMAFAVITTPVLLGANGAKKRASTAESALVDTERALEKSKEDSAKEREWLFEALTLVATVDALMADVRVASFVSSAYPSEEALESAENIAFRVRRAVPAQHKKEGEELSLDARSVIAEVRVGVNQRDSAQMRRINESVLDIQDLMLTIYKNTSGSYALDFSKL